MKSRSANAPVQGKTSTECHVKSAGEASGTIKTKPLTTELVYLGTEKEAREGTKLGELLSPKEGKALVEVEIAANNCPALTTGTQKVEGTVAAEASPSGAQSKTPKLIFPSSAIKAVYKSKAEGEIEEVKSGLTSFGLVAVTMAGTEKFELESKEEFGPF